MPPPSEEELAEQHRRDKETKTYKWKDTNGVEREKDFTLRQALDRQRDMERGMRATRKQIKMFEAAGQPGEATVIKALYTMQRKEYERFSSAMGLQPDWNRVTMDGLGRVGGPITRQPLNITTPTGLHVAEVSKHAFKRMAERNVTHAGLKDALQNPLHIGRNKIDADGQKSVEYLGRSARVIVNPDDGTIITTWQTSRKLVKKYGGG